MNIMRNLLSENSDKPLSVLSLYKNIRECPALQRAQAHKEQIDQCRLCQALRMEQRSKTSPTVYIM